MLLKPVYKKGELLRTFREISKLRFKSLYFYFDLVAAFPSVTFDEIAFKHLENNDGRHSIYNVLYILKLFKLRYAFKVVNKAFDLLKLRSHGDTRRILKLAISLGVIVHIMSCLMIFMGRYQNNSQPGWILSSDLRDSTDGEIYITSAYWAIVTVTSVGYGDISLTTHTEVLFTVIMMAIGSMFYTVFISVVANFFMSLNKVETLYLVYDSSIEYFRKTYGVPDKLAYELRNYFKANLKGIIFECLL